MRGLGGEGKSSKLQLSSRIRMKALRHAGYPTVYTNLDQDPQSSNHLDFGAPISALMVFSESRALHTQPAAPTRVGTREES